MDPLDPEALPAVLDNARALILDIRPHSAYAVARLPNALSLTIPSTLLKRSTFTLSKLAAMICSSSARARFEQWRSASVILVYDADSSSVADAANILGLLRKFAHEGFTRPLHWLRGGIHAVWRDHRHLIEHSPPSDDDEHDTDSHALRARNLPSEAFHQSSTTIVPLPANAGVQADLVRTAANPFYDNIRQNIELSQGIIERIPLSLPPQVCQKVHNLPFKWLKDIAAAANNDSGTDALASQFHRIELGEQRRLQGIMAHHSTNPSSHVAFPFSITAGIEKGTKNRYRNIWPFEHARVRLRSHTPDDYVNASHVQPLGTRRRYIATQGPLPSTFNDFWALVWEQDVRVIVMLTKEIENAVPKCANYWCQSKYGAFTLETVGTSQTGQNQPDVVPSLFGGADENEDLIVHRVFHLHHAGQTRVITHLQYLGWPDMNVPDSPQGLLRLIKRVNDAIQDGDEDRPVLLHCSAGVGRTGGFIMVDAILDGVKRELRQAEVERSQVRKESAKATRSIKPQNSTCHCEAALAARANSEVRFSSLVFKHDAQGQQNDVARGLSQLKKPADDREPKRADAFSFFDLKASNPCPLFSPSPVFPMAHGKPSLKMRSRLDTIPALGHMPPTPGVFTAADANSMFTTVNPAFQMDAVSTVAPLKPSVGFTKNTPTKGNFSAKRNLALRLGLNGSFPQTPAVALSSVAEVENKFELDLGKENPAVVPTSFQHPLQIPKSIPFVQVQPCSHSSGSSSGGSSPDHTTSEDSTPPPPPGTDSHPPVKVIEDVDAERVKPAFDYTLPRELNSCVSPLMLSHLEEPVRQVLEDMREQRMSLCQSLRQYVFVHRAIIEGVLQILEERQPRTPVGMTQDVEMANVGPTTPPLHTAYNSTIGSKMRLILDGTGFPATISTALPSPSLHGKRGASPTELLKEGRKGEVVLSKRASIKRQTSGASVPRAEI